MLHSDVQKRKSPVEGFGLIATAHLPRGTVVWTAGGHDQQLAVTHKQLRRLPKRVHHLAYRIRDHYVLCFDGSQFTNHSCDPNLVWADDDTMIAARDIEPGEEVTFDYGTSEIHLWWRPKWRCRCGGAHCRGVLTGRDCLDPAFQERYRGHLPSWVLEFIERNRGWRGWFYARLFDLAEAVRRLRGQPAA